VDSQQQFNLQLEFTEMLGIFIAASLSAMLTIC